MNVKISLAGDLGSGKSTVANILIEKLGVEYYSTGAIVRSIAARRGMSVVELNVYMETHPEIDTEIDNGLKELSHLDKSMIIDSRMAWHFTEGTFKVYLSTSPEVSAFRIMNANRVGEHAATLEQTIAETKARRNSEKKRYLEQYGVDIKDLTNYDLVVDTTLATPDQVAGTILDSLEKWNNNNDFSLAYISPERLNYPDDEPDAQLVDKYAELLDVGGPIAYPEVFEEEGEFYVSSSPESALAYVFTWSLYVPCRLIKGRTDGRKYVKMQNSL